MARLFGTDGIRGRFGEEPLVEPTVRRIGAALGRLLAPAGPAPLVLLAGDTRASSPRLAAWLAAGLAARGARPLDLGVLPTAAVARLVPARGAAAGVVLSASHNPAEDNGIKLIAADGFKWPLAEEARLEAAIAVEPEPQGDAPPARDDRAASGYLAALRAELPGERPLAGLAAVLDCGHGAASALAGPLLADLGARVVTLGDRPDGTNINRDAGSTHPQGLAARVAAGGFDLGFAFDGDADRAILVDERGVIRDGDAMLFLLARDLFAGSPAAPRAIVATSMSNLGLERALAAEGIELLRCGVGDREVVEMLRARGLRLGGEQSGHIVDLARSTTGDGLLTALLIAGIVARAGRPVSQLLAPFRRYPQLLLNVRVKSRPPLESLPGVAAAIAAVETRLGADGRLVLRYSGTEPLARVMLEGPDEPVVTELAAALADAIRAAIGA
jgi:phosphoglucosamine mutase